MGQQRFQIQFDFNANMGPVKASVAELQKSLGGLNLPPTLAANFEKLFGKLSTEMAEFETMTKNGFTNMADVNKAQTSFARITKLLGQIGVEVTKVKGLNPEKLLPKEMQTRLSSLTKKFAELKAQQDKKDGYTDKIAKQTKAIKEQETALENLRTRRKALAKENVEAGAAKGRQASDKAAAEARKEQVVSRMTELEGTKGGKSSAEYKDLHAELTRLNTAIKSCDSEMARLTSTINRNKGSMAGLDGDIGAAETTLRGLRDELSQLESVGIDPKSLQALRQELATLQGTSLDKIPTDLKEIETLMDQIGQSSLAPVITQTGQVEQNLHKVDNAADGARDALKGAADSAQHLNRAAQDVENLKNQVYQFFSLTNSVQLFKRAVTSAMNTVKELDATMTEAAVVTEFDVSDMWDRLPEYSASAQKLGVSINGMYQATTLYYQQGLKTNEAMALGVETMKMAKIAGMESADATTAMTAALRGFNMELNEASAVKVNDVYSKLAAITAADVSQISTAMEKTASIANSANMEFETTAALLAQIIETTQEAPETAGTALKTIIARFSEVKKLQSEGKSSGEDSEGEIIDVNKIQTALRSVGISMEGFFQGTEGLDSVLLKLAEKWDTLDFGTQRYIATMAAGSRQQSRFLAMMSDYGRTTELVSEANNSAGASQTQFNKTLDSMESKLQKLENAWNEFLMGLSNNEILKGAVDTLTLIITGVNKITDAISGGNGLVKSIVSLATVLGTLKLGKSLLGGALGSGLGWAGQKMGVGGQPGANPQQPGQAPAGGQPTPMPNPQGSGDQAGTGWGTGFLAAVLKKLDAGRHTVEAKAESLAGTDEGQAAGKKRERYEAKAQKNLKKQHGGTGRARKGGNDAHVAQSTEGYLKSIENLNKETEGFDMAPVRAEFESTYAKTGDLGKAMDAAGAKTRELGGTMMSESEKTKMMNDATNGLSSAFSGAGMAAMAAGAAVNALGALFEKLGMEEAAEACSWVGTALMGVGAALMMLPGLISGVASVATAAGISVQAAWWWLLIIMVVIISIIALVYVLCQAFEAASEAAQLEKMKEQLEDLRTATEEAKKALEDMASAQEELESMGETLNGLTKGTKEWRKALIANNQKVLELLNTYPQLAEYVDKGLNGELIIKEEGWDAMMSQQQQAYTASLGAQTAMEGQVANKERYIETEALMAEKVGGGGKKDYADFMDTGWGKTAAIGGGLLAGAGAGAATGALIGAIGGPIGAAAGAAIGGLIGTVSGVIAAVTPPDPEDVEREQTGGLTYDELQDFSAIAAERGYSNADGSLNEAAVQEILNETGITLAEGYDVSDLTNSLNGLGTEFDELALAAQEARAAELAKVDAIAASVAQTSKVVTDSEDFGGVAEEMGAQAFGDYSDQVEQVAKGYSSDLDVKDKNLDEGEANKAIERYAKLQGMTAAEVRTKVEKGELDRETIAKTLAADDVDQKMVKAMEGTVKVLEKRTKDMSKQEKNNLKAIMTDRGEGANVGSIKAIEEAGGVGKYLQQQGFTTQDALDMGYESWSDFVKAMESNYKTGTAAFADIETQIKSVGLEFEDLPDALTAGAAQGLADKLTMVAAVSGEEMAQQINDAYKGITDGLDAEDVQVFTSYLTDIDWSNTDDIEEFRKQMENMNIPVGEMDAFIEKMKEAAGATEELSFEKFNKVLEDVSGVYKNLQSGEQGRTFSQEEYEALVASGAAEEGDFIQDFDGTWKYVGDSLTDLEEAIRENTDALLGKTLKQLETKGELGGKLNTLVDDKDVNVLTKLKSNDSETQKAGLQKLIADSGLDLSLLGIEGLTNETDLSYLTPEQIKAISSKVLTIAGNSTYYAAEAEDKKQGSQTKAYAMDDPHAIAMGVNAVDNATTHQMSVTTPGQEGPSYIREFSGTGTNTDLYNAVNYTGENKKQVLINAIQGQFTNPWTYEAVDTATDDQILEQAKAWTLSHQQGGTVPIHDFDPEAMGDTPEEIRNYMKETMFSTQKYLDETYGIDGLDAVKGLSNEKIAEIMTDGFGQEVDPNDTNAVLEAKNFLGGLYTVQATGDYGMGGVTTPSLWELAGVGSVNDLDTLSEDKLLEIANTLMGGDVQGLIDALIGNDPTKVREFFANSATTDEERQYYEEEMTDEEIMQSGWDLASQSGELGLAQLLQSESEEAVNYIESWLESYVSNGGNLSALGIEGLKTLEDLRNASDETVRAAGEAALQLSSESGQEEDFKNRADAMRLMAVRYGVSEGALARFNAVIESGTRLEKEHALAVMANTVAEKKAEQQYGRTLKALGDVNDEYSETNKGDQGYEDALYAYGQALNLDMTNMANYDFVAENLDLIRQAAEGDIDAILRLRELMTQDYGFTLTVDGNFSNYNEGIDLADQKTIDFINNQIKSGMFEIVTVEVKSGMEYLVPTGDGGFEVKTMETDGYAQIVRPQDATSIQRAQNYGGAKTGGGGETEKWENPYDELYNTQEKINATLREREKIERNYDRLLNKRNTKGSELIQNAKDQLALLEEEAKLQQEMADGKLEQINEHVADKSKYNKYATFDEATGMIQIDWDEINKVTDTEKGAEIEEYISKLEELRDAWQESNDRLEEIADTTDEILDQGKDSYFDLEERIKEAVVGERQDEIDELTAINESINDTNTKLMDAIQSSVDEYRQNRDNAETEEDLANKQRKIAYLSQDTSGANALEILQLQEELDEATEDYTDTLIDQKISELQDQNDAAAEQRQEQIDLMQAQLDQYVSSGEVWTKVYELMDSGLDEDGVKVGSALWKLLEQQEGLSEKSELGKLEWAEEIRDVGAEAVQWLAMGNSTEALLKSKELKKGQTIEFKTADGKTLKGQLKENGDIVADGKTYKDVYRNYDGKYITTENYQGKAEDKPKEEPKPAETYAPKVNDYVKVSSGAKFVSGESIIEDVRKSGVISGKPGAFKVLKDAGNGNFYIGKSWTTHGVTGQINKKYLTKYETGGLADFTGPAWLDGTKSKPEYILNADQTKAFFTLVDVLQGLKEVPKNSSATQNTGDNTYDIDINVESIGSDYDVDQLAERVKSLINQDARYRNNNTAGVMR